MRAFARKVNKLLRSQSELVVETNEIQAALSDGEVVDAMAAMQLLRELAARHQWSTFVFDYGALVRIASCGMKRDQRIRGRSARAPRK